MDAKPLAESVSDLSDLELAVLLSLVAEQHCLITTDDALIDDLAAELSLIVSETFDLQCSILSTEQQQSVEGFGAAILNDTPGSEFAATDGGDDNDDNGSITQPSRLASTSIRAGSYVDTTNLDRRMVVNVIIAKHFNFAHRDVQIATLELIQRRRIYSRTTVHPVPKTFLFIPLVAASTKGTKLNYHLNDRISISHHHAAQDGFANLEELDQRSLDSPTQISEKSGNSLLPRITTEMVKQIRSTGQNVNMTPEIRRYIQDIVVFLRMERGVDGGITPFASTLCVALSKFLAVLHGIDYVTPSLVNLAVRKVYAHRIVMTTPDRDRSMQWGSDLEAVKRVLRDLTPEGIIDNVLAAVECPI